jgi:hypothetical protein
MKRMDTAEMHYRTTVARYRMTDHKRDKNSKEEMGITDINHHHQWCYSPGRALPSLKGFCDC